MTYNFEYDRKVRAGFIGCGGHAYRNIFPTFQYAPVDLIAVCDLQPNRAAAFARQFGARQTYTDHREMLARERLDAVFVVAGYDEHHRPLHPHLAMDAMRAGAHVWIEKPPASSLAEVKAMQTVSRDTDRFVSVGYKKMFFPAIAKAREISQRPEFGQPTSLVIRYPQGLPPLEARSESRAMRCFLDHFFHPASIVHSIMGPVTTVTYQREPLTGGSVSTVTFASGAVGAMHLAGSQSWSGPLERLEIVGEGAFVVVENGVNLRYYREGARRGQGSYGRAASYIGTDEESPVVWEPEFSLGQLYNKNLFLLGYAPEVLYFCDCVLDDRPPELANLDDTLAMMRWYECYRQPAGQKIVIPGHQPAHEGH
ncbi:MAG: hypothetical protein CL878_02400 [Dehalococcoidia bacterium]|nr:hypothetical protein [Dehalococcoidia bacterium]